MPEGSSSEAPVIKPGPSDRSSCLRSPAVSPSTVGGEGGGGAGSTSFAIGCSRMTMTATKVRFPRGYRTGAANAVWGVSHTLCIWSGLAVFGSWFGEHLKPQLERELRLKLETLSPLIVGCRSRKNGE